MRATCEGVEVVVMLVSPSVVMAGGDIASGDGRDGRVFWARTSSAASANAPGSTEATRSPRTRAPIDSSGGGPSLSLFNECRWDGYPERQPIAKCTQAARRSPRMSLLNRLNGQGAPDQCHDRGGLGSKVPCPRETASLGMPEKSHGGQWQSHLDPLVPAGSRVDPVSRCREHGEILHPTFQRSPIMTGKTMTGRKSS
jgi:hypothetical protein